MFARFCVFTCVVGIIVACGDKTKKDPDGDETGQGGNTILSGSEWRVGCTANTSAFAGYKSMTRSLKFDANNYSEVSHIFYTETCTGHLLTITRRGSFAFRPSSITQSANPSGIYEIDDQLQSFTIRVVSTQVASGFKDNKYCGIDNWKTERNYDVTNRVCDTQRPYQIQPRFNIFMLDLEAKPQTLRFGEYTAILDGLSPQKRPNQLEDVLLTR